MDGKYFNAYFAMDILNYIGLKKIIEKVLI